jgi:hypothetical protein
VKGWVLQVLGAVNGSHHTKWHTTQAHPTLQQHLQTQTQAAKDLFLSVMGSWNGLCYQF